jgi:hypothetical protein
MQTILKTFSKLFSVSQDASQVRLNLFVQSMNPKSSADVDRIICEYDRMVNKGGMYS